MAREWTCRKCKAKLPRVKPRCPTCGRSRPKARPPKHRDVLNQITYERAVELVGERCGICGTGPKTRRLHRDHDHRTGEFRGLLCFPCNAALRPYMTLEWVLNAAKYLDRDGIGQL
jgi:hypothetical protein